MLTLEEVAKAICCTMPGGKDDGIWPCGVCAKNLPLEARPCADQARAVMVLYESQIDAAYERGFLLGREQGYWEGRDEYEER